MTKPKPSLKITGRGALVAVVVVALLAAWFLAFFRPESHKLQTLDAERNSLQATVAVDQARLRRVQNEAAHVTQIQAMDNRLVGYAPTTEGLYTYIHTISAAAKVAGVTITSLDAGSMAPVPATPYSAVPIAASIKGTYDQILAFLKGLYALPRLTDINDVSVSGGGPGTNRATVLTVSLQLAIFTSQGVSGS